jgi:hypothetical protein
MKSFENKNDFDRLRKSYTRLFRKAIDVGAYFVISSLKNDPVFETSEARRQIKREYRPLRRRIPLKSIERLSILKISVS